MLVEMSSYLLRLVSVFAFLLVWHAAVSWNVRWPLQFGNLPLPWDVAVAWYHCLFQASYYRDIATSAYRVLVGIGLGFAAAVPLGLWIGLSRKIRDTILTNLELFRPVPLIAYLPVAMLLFRTIESSIIFITFLGAFFPILVSSIDAVKRVPSSLLQAARCLGCGPARTIWHVYLPAIGPEILTGLKVGVGASWMGVITAEMMSGQVGIGYFTWAAYQLMDYKKSIIGMFTIGALGFASSAVVRLVERLLIRWKPI